MKPVEAAPTGNLTVAQLSKALTKPAAEPAKTKPEAKALTPATSREPLPAGDEGDGAGDEPPDLSHSANPSGAAKPEDQTADNADGTDEGQGEETPAEDEGGEIPETPEAPKAASVSDVVVTRLNAELQPLIDELTKAGAKGALQILQKRIPRLVDQRDTERNGRLSAEQKLTELETELEQSKASKGEASGLPQGAGHPMVAKVTKAIGEVDGFIAKFKANPNGFEMDDGDGGTIEFTADEVAEHLDKLRDRRTELLTERKFTEQQVQEHFQQAERHYSTVAAKAYPWLTQPDAPEQGRMKQLLQLLPGLKALPDYKLVIGHYLRGEAAAIAELKAKGQPPASRKAPPSREPTKVVAETPGSKAGPADAKATAAKAVKDAEAQFKKSGKTADLQKLEAAKSKVRRLS